MKAVSEKTCRENQNTHTVLNSPFLNSAFCEIVWENMVDREDHR